MFSAGDEELTSYDFRAQLLGVRIRASRRQHRRWRNRATFSRKIDIK